MPETGLPAGEERRQSTRFPRDQTWENAVVRRASGKELAGGLRDESLGGVSLFLNEIDTVKVDDEVEVSFSGEKLTSRVRYIQPQQDGGFVVGFASSS